MSGASRSKVVSLKNAATRRQIWREVEFDEQLRAAIFKRVQRGKRLQVLLVRAMASHSKLRQQFLEELSRDPQFRARLFRLAGQKA